MKRLIWLACASISLSLPGCANTIYDVASDFSLASNPNGVWTYGSETTLGGALTFYTSASTTAGLDLWGNPSTFAGAGHNPTAGPTGGGGSSCSVPAGDDLFGPGVDGSFSVYRFTAPAVGMFDIEASFFGGDFSGPTTSDVHVLLNGVSLFSDNINGFGPSSAKNYSGIRTFNVGDTVDFIVGIGTDGTFNFDSTGLTATLSSVSAAPEPATLALMGAPLLVLWRLRRGRLRTGR
jgi:hypothetical protein